MACSDALSTCVQAWQGTPVVAIAVSGLVAAVVESPSARHRSRPRSGAALTIGGAIAFVAAGALAATGLVLPAVLVLAGGLAASAGAVWLLRDPTHDGGHGGGGRGPDPPSPGDPAGGGIDWDAFEREFAAYVNARARVPVG
jgi:hypothetical protein